MIKKRTVLVLMMVFVYTILVLNVQNASKEVVKFYNMELLENEKDYQKSLKEYLKCSDAAYMSLRNNKSKEKFIEQKKQIEEKTYIVSFSVILLLALTLNLVIRKIYSK